MKFFTWFAGFFEDQKKSASSKRATLYIALGFFFLIINDVIKNNRPFPDTMVLFTNIGIILVCLGIVGAEFFKQKPFGNDPDKTV